MSDSHHFPSEKLRSCDCGTQSGLGLDGAAAEFGRTFSALA